MHTPPRTYTPATRAAIAKGPLTKSLLNQRLEAAAQLGVHPLDVFTEPEAQHLLAVRNTLKDPVFKDILDAFEAVG